jgi:hypothetical protein
MNNGEKERRGIMNVEWRRTRNQEPGIRRQETIDMKRKKTKEKR